MNKKNPNPDIPTPPLPKFLLNPKDAESAQPEALKPEDIRARIQLESVAALDILAWHARNLGDPKTSVDACRELLDRAGYVAPAKGKADGVSVGGSGGAALPPIEQDTKEIADAFSSMPTPRRKVEEDEA